VPGRNLPADVRPPYVGPTDAWEPRDTNLFRQPFSWGINDSPTNTVIHAADLYEPDRNPLWYKLRYQIPFVGGYKRDVHCLSMINPLVKNGYKSFAIPWGAGHMSIMSTILEDNGFEQIGMTGLLVVGAVDGTYSAGVYRRIRYTLRTITALEFAVSATAGYLLCRFVGVDLLLPTLTVTRSSGDS
jgi:hypothetical protein